MRGEDVKELATAVVGERVVVRVEGRVKLWKEGLVEEVVD